MLTATTTSISPPPPPPQSPGSAFDSEAALRDEISRRQRIELGRRSTIGSFVYIILLVVVEMFSDRLNMQNPIERLLASSILICSLMRFFASTRLESSRSGISNFLVFNFFRAMLALLSISWGLFSAWACFQFGIVVDSMLILFLTAGIAGGSLVSLSPSFSLLLLSTTGLLLPVLVILFIIGATSFAVSGLIFFIFMLTQTPIVSREFLRGIRNQLIIQKQNEDLKIARNEALTAVKVKSEFLASMSHEIRTPMNGIIGLSNLLAERPLDGESAQFVNHIKDCGESLLVIINGILDFSKIESGRMHIESHPFDLLKCVHSVEKLLGIKAAEKGLSLTVEIADEVPQFVLGDLTRVRQVLTNLLHNAVKFTDSGSVSIRIARVSPTTLHFSIQDSGIGIEPSNNSQLFKPFSQVSPFATRIYGGTGLGLAISKELVSAMGGEIGVESKYGNGSKFWFTLPLAGCERTEEPQLLVDDLHLSNFSILVAEDNAVNKLLIKGLLKKLSIKAEYANNGLEAIEAVGQHHYDLVLMDIQMPEMSGLEATEFIVKSMAPADRPYIVAVTANAMPGDREICLEAGMDDYISKPIREQDLRRVLAHLGALAKASADRSDRQILKSASQIWDVTSAIENVGGDKTIIIEIIGAFLSTAPEILAKIGASLEADEIEVLQKTAHLFKGAVLTLGESQVANLARELNALAVKGDSSTCREQCHVKWLEMIAAYEHFKSELEAFARSA